MYQDLCPELQPFYTIKNYWYDDPTQQAIEIVTRILSMYRNDECVLDIPCFNSDRIPIICNGDWQDKLPLKTKLAITGAIWPKKDDSYNERAPNGKRGLKNRCRLKSLLQHIDIDASRQFFDELFIDQESGWLICDNLDKVQQEERLKEILKK